MADSSVTKLTAWCFFPLKEEAHNRWSDGKKSVHRASLQEHLCVISVDSRRSRRRQADKKTEILESKVEQCKAKQN